VFGRRRRRHRDLRIKSWIKSGGSEGTPQIPIQFLSIFLDKIRNSRYVFLLTESMPARRLPGPGNESLRLLEMFATTTTARALDGGGFPYFNWP
jgi:hypothetical protein